MISPRARAALFVCLLISGLAFTAVWMVSWLGSVGIQGTAVIHADGDVISVGPGRNFVLETATGKQMAFVCSADCQASQRHLQRHLKEKAHTDVYYIQGPHHELLVVDAD
jgi:hypothetical protein